MCGIAGILHLQGTLELQDDVKRMARAMAHRGPDGEGFHVRDNIALGSRRLAIIDLETGQQPIFNEDGQVCVVFNGEIYNYRELSKLLQSLGHTFRTKSDTEVIVHAWEEWGKQCVEKFRGMFAFALADWRQRVLFLARDHFGIKPLYYMMRKEGLVFASEIQGMRALDGFADELDLRALDQFLYLQYIPAPRTIFRDVRKLPPAHRMVVRFDGHTDGPERYWSLRFQPQHRVSLEDWVQRLEEVVRDSVKTHLVSDVPFGALLSGGLDSTTIVGMMAQELGRPVQTFTIGFEEQPYDESGYAKEVAEFWKTDHHVQILKSDAIRILPKLIEHYGEPFGDSSAIPTFFVSQLARKHVPMVLSGDGGDEAFGGYITYQCWQDWLYPRAPRRPLWKRTLRPIATSILPERYPPDPGPRTRTLESWQNFVQYFGPDFRRTLWRKEYQHLVELPVEVFEQAFHEAPQDSSVSQAQYMDYETYLPYDILTKVDIASMAHSLEVRTPLVDLRVVEFAASIPPSLKLKQDRDGNWISKKVLRTFLSRYFPDRFLNRPKRGFSGPVGDWFMKGGLWRNELEEDLLNPRARIYEYLDSQTVTNMLVEHGERRNLGGPLWLLFYLENWMKHWQKAPVPI